MSPQEQLAARARFNALFDDFFTVAETNGARLAKIADAQRIPLRTIEQVKADLIHAKTLEAGTDAAMARLMLRHGRLTDEARKWINEEYPQ